MLAFAWYNGCLKRAQKRSNKLKALEKEYTMAEKNNIVLIGMPGAGKSTLGIVLAKILNYNFIDADLVIQNQCDKTLQKLIDACGPEGFIQVENQILSDLNAEHSIIATGGSAVYSDEAMKHLSDIGRVVYLQISYDELKRRLSDLQERGVVLKGGITMSLQELFDERKPLYEHYAEITVDVNDLSIEAAARKVADALQ
jgi:shikimate kinase